jgi:hypothetical protein
MKSITRQQLTFLNQHQIPLSAVFDASGLRPKEYKSVMRELDKYVAIGVSPCQKLGHTMRLRAGHCLECNTEGLAHFYRHHKNAIVYVAASLSRRIMKIGFTKNIENREESLNRTEYARINDWKIIYHAQCSNAGKIEYQIQHRLNPYSIKGEYKKEGRTIACYELFQCSYTLAKAAIQNVRSEFPNEFLYEKEITENINIYNFENSSVENPTRKRLNPEVKNTIPPKIQIDIKYNTQPFQKPIDTIITKNNSQTISPIFRGSSKEKSSFYKDNKDTIKFILAILYVIFCILQGIK